MSFQLKISKNGWILFAACLSLFALGLADNIRGPLFPELIRFFKLSHTEAALSFAVTSCFGFIGNIFSERILRIVSLSNLLLVSLLGMAFSLFFMSYANYFSFYLGGAAFFGFCMGLLGVSQNLLVAENFAAGQQSQALSGLHCLYGFSSLLAPFMASYAPFVLGPWRAGFTLTALLAVLIFGIILFSRPKQMNFVTQTEVEKQTSDASQPFFRLLCFGGILAFYVIAEILVSSRLALYMRTYFGKNLQESSLYVTWFFVFLLMGRLLFTFKKFPFNLRAQLNVLLLLSILCLVLGLAWHPFFMTFVGFTFAPFYPLGVAYLSEQTGVHKRRFITFGLGFQNFCLICMHLGVGFLSDQIGLLKAFGVGVVSLVLALLCVNFHPSAKD